MLAGDNPSLDAGGPVGRADKAPGWDAVGLEQASKDASVGVVADNAREAWRGPERGEVPGHVGGSPGICGLFFHMNDGDRCFWGDSGDASINELIQHEVADHQDPEAAETGQGGP